MFDRRTMNRNNRNDEVTRGLKESLFFFFHPGSFDGTMSDFRQLISYKGLQVTCFPLLTNKALSLWGTGSDFSVLCASPFSSDDGRPLPPVAECQVRTQKHSKLLLIDFY